jgi:hypothetical protein
MLQHMVKYRFHKTRKYFPTIVYVVVHIFTLCEFYNNLVMKDVSIMTRAVI